MSVPNILPSDRVGLGDAGDAAGDVGEAEAAAGAGVLTVDCGAV